jgi:beta-fructofuranosidase
MNAARLRGELHELDAGFEFTPANDAGGRWTTHSDWLDGRTGRGRDASADAVARLDAPDDLPARIALSRRQLWQTPVRELAALREEEQHWQGRASDAPVLDAARLEFELSASQVNVDFAGALRLTVDEQGVRLERASLKTGETLTRYWLGDVHHLRVLCDRSSVEIFINHGEGVMSSRYFPDHPAWVRFEGASDITLRYWSLRACMIE